MSSEGIVKQQFSVPFQYTVAFTRDVFGKANPLLLQTLTAQEPLRKHKAMLILDEGVERSLPHLRSKVQTYFAAHDDRIHLVADPLLVPGGEHAKNDPAVLTRLLEALREAHMDRHSFVLTMGGGAVLDVTGYAAAITHRGLRTVRLPSTVLAQNDSGVGVKNGVNAFGAKNFLGTFHPPFAVINDFDLLNALPVRERVAGYAEAVKVALIRDAGFFDWLETHAAALAEGKPAPLAALVRRAAELHLTHIASAGDPFEQGSARPLDFGHWSAHKLESLTHHEVRHGEAVALGMLLDARYCVLAERLPVSEFDRIATLIDNLGLPTWHPALELLQADGTLAVLSGLEEFREHLGGDLTVTLLTHIGGAEEVHEMDGRVVTQAITDLKIWNQRKLSRADGTDALG